VFQVGDEAPTTISSVGSNAVTVLAVGAVVAVVTAIVLYVLSP
jgi:hypothetical protein